MQFLLENHNLDRSEIDRNSETVTWPTNVLPVFDENAMLIESVKQRSEQHLLSKREKLMLEIEKVSPLLGQRPSRQPRPASLGLS